jgi:pimeloyl-ACP methyl ester carboxylesterase
MPTRMIRDTELYFERAGAGPELVFVHGMCGGGWVWEDQVARLCDRFTCVTYDRRGHSRSEDDRGDQSDAAHADDLARLIEVLGLDRPIVVASSGGAVVATEFLHRYPTRVRGAVLSEPPLFSIEPSAGEEIRAMAQGPLSEAMRRGGPPAAVEAFFGIVAPTLWGRLDASRRDAYRANGSLLFATLEAQSTTVSVADLAACRVPTWVVVGAQTVPVFSRIARRLVDALPDGHLVELAGACHATYVEAPQAFAETVREAARACGPAGQRSKARPQLPAAHDAASSTIRDASPAISPTSCWWK